MGIYKAKARKKFAVVKTDGESKFPIGDKAHARAALARLNQAKPPLTAGQKAKVKAKARSMLAKGK
jgi:hypothetical protein